MNMSKSAPWALQPPPLGARLRACKLAAAALRQAGHYLARVSRRLRQLDAAASAAVTPELEFYAEAGAPEGALFADGQRIGTVEGVRRL